MSEINRNCKGVKIESRPSVKYLGAVNDQAGKTLATSIIKKVNPGFKILSRKSGFLKLKELKLLLCALLWSCFDYAFNVYYRDIEIISKSSYK